MAAHDGHSPLFPLHCQDCKPSSAPKDFYSITRRLWAAAPAPIGGSRAGRLLHTKDSSETAELLRYRSPRESTLRPDGDHPSNQALAILSFQEAHQIFLGNDTCFDKLTQAFIDRYVIVAVAMRGYFL